jgi:hypothetical protein
MPLILFWAEVEEEDEKSIFSGLMKREEKDETSVLSGLMKMEEDEVEEEKETSIFSGMMEREETKESDLLYWEMVTDHLWVAKIHSCPHHPKTTGDQA